MKNITNIQKRHFRVRSKVSGTEEKPRLSVYRSNKHIYAQLIDDVNGKTLVGVNTKFVESKGTKLSMAEALGEDIAKKAIDKGIKNVVFDRGGYRYHGRIKAVADAARKSGLVF